MSIVSSVRAVLVPVNREGYPFIAIAGVLTGVSALLFTPLFWPLVGLTVWVALFFRDPPRVTPLRPGLVIAPADGRVSMITNAAPPPELAMGDTPRPRVSIFMNVFNCHVNRAPVTGRIEHIAYTPGAFLNADLDKASELNERNGFVISALQDGRPVTLGVVQIAGLVARRIVVWARAGEAIGVGERLGMIRFGSRVDVYLPVGVKPLVGEGQTTLAGETIIADLGSVEAGRSFKVG